MRVPALPPLSAVARPRSCIKASSARLKYISNPAPHSSVLCRFFFHSFFSHLPLLISKAGITGAGRLRCSSNAPRSPSTRSYRALCGWDKKCYALLNVKVPEATSGTKKPADTRTWIACCKSRRAYQGSYILIATAGEVFIFIYFFYEKALQRDQGLRRAFSKPSTQHPSLKCSIHHSKP